MGAGLVLKEARTNIHKHTHTNTHTRNLEPTHVAFKKKKKSYGSKNSKEGTTTCRVESREGVGSTRIQEHTHIHSHAHTHAHVHTRICFFFFRELVLLNHSCAYVKRGRGEGEAYRDATHGFARRDDGGRRRDDKSRRTLVETRCAIPNEEGEERQGGEGDGKEKQKKNKKHREEPQKQRGTTTVYTESAGLPRVSLASAHGNTEEACRCLVGTAGAKVVANVGSYDSLSCSSQSRRTSRATASTSGVLAVVVDGATAAASSRVRRKWATTRSSGTLLSCGRKQSL